MKNDKIICVNATSLRSGGALTILNQFLSAVKNKHTYYLFVDDSIVLNHIPDNVRLVSVNVRGFFKRIIWDFHGINKWFKSNNINYHLAISLQNTTFYTSNKPLIVYLHQAIPFADKKWSFLRKDERKYFFYKNVYPFFIFWHKSEQTDFVVQTNWLKDKLVNNHNCLDSRVHVIKPNFSDISDGHIEKLKLDHEISIFYPASSELFKNHIVLIEALSLLKQAGDERFGLYFTIDKNEVENLVNAVNDNGLSNQVNFLGAMTFDEVMKYYKSSDIVAFPSLIESLGLPLIEAAKFGKPIISNATQTSLEVISSYSHVKFVNNEACEWANAISELSELNIKKEPFIPEFDTNWNDFFSLVDNVFR